MRIQRRKRLMRRDSSSSDDDLHHNTGVIIRKRDDDALTPRNILCTNQSFVDQLFELFDSQDSPKQISQNVWELLMLLPTNPRILLELHSLETSDWGRLLNPKSPFQLLYALQILESIVLEVSKDDVNKSNKFMVTDLLG
jgi:hypothetical protein